jgi:magnesium-transporting ATPase (P-type)
MRIVAYCLVVGLGYSLSWSFLNSFSTQSAWELLAGVLLAAVFVPVVRWSSFNRGQLLGAIWIVLWYVGSANLLIEGSIFIERTVAEFWHEAVSDLICATVVAVLLVLLAEYFRVRPPQPFPTSTPFRPSRRSLLWRIPVAVFGYLLLYFLVGFLMYTLFFRPFYTDPTMPLRDNQEVAAMLGLWFVPIQIGRALGIVLVSLPIAYSLRVSRPILALTLALILWVVGGFSSLVVPGSWPPALRFYHSVEILLQNGGLAIVLAWLFRLQKTRKTS